MRAKRLHTREGGDPKIKINHLAKCIAPPPPPRQHGNSAARQPASALRAHVSFAAHTCKRFTYCTAYLLPQSLWRLHPLANCVNMSPTPSTHAVPLTTLTHLASSHHELRPHRHRIPLDHRPVSHLVHVARCLAALPHRLHLRAYLHQFGYTSLRPFSLFRLQSRMRLSPRSVTTGTNRK